MQLDLLDNLEKVYEKLNPRERLFVLAGGGSLLLLLLFLALSSIVQKRQELGQRVVQAREDYGRILRLREDISTMPPPREIPDRNQFKSAIFNLMESHGLKGDLRDSVKSISRSEEAIVEELVLKGVVLKNVIDFMHDIEYGHKINCRIDGVSFRRSLPGREIYDVNLSLAVNRPRSGREN